jgi:serine phosphatase RsbU (regulator of sigma subunit)
LEQVRIRQELLAAQAGRGISYFYRNILENLDLLARATPAKSSAKDPLPPVVWEQLRGRATYLIEVDLATHRPVTEFRDEPKVDLVRLSESAAPWLATLDHPTIGDPTSVGTAGALMTLVAAPVRAAGDAKPTRAWVAVVPMLSIETRFLNDLNQSATMSSNLADDRQRIVSSRNRSLVGTDLTSAAQVDPRIREVVEESVRTNQRITREFLKPVKVGRIELEPAMETIQPVDLPDGRIWRLGVASSLAEADAAVARFFRRALIGAGVLIAAITAILVSSSTQMIRGRLRLERVQRAMLTRELDQAREIQLMWLPEQQKTDVPIDVAAVNRPASHVSGDFYNWFELGDGRVCVVIGDVTGHGLPAAFLMATTQLLVRTILERVGDPGRCLREVNRLLCTHVFSGQFVTLLVMIVDTKTNTLELATAGHPAPLIGAGECLKPLDVEPQLVMAVEHDVSYRTQRFDLPDGASLLLYTDGVTDVQSPSGERLSEEALPKCVFGSFRAAEDIIAAVLDAIDAFRAGREAADDLTLVAVQLQKQLAAKASALTTESPALH